MRQWYHDTNAGLVLGSMFRTQGMPLPKVSVLVLKTLMCWLLHLYVLQDIVLFEAIISDLFPDTDMPNQEDQQLSMALQTACRACGLQPETAFIGKAQQLHDTLGVRFGVMLVGPAGGY